MTVRSANLSVRHSTWSYKSVPKNISPHIADVWVYVIPNLHIMDISQAIRCEACFVSEQYVAAKEWILGTLAKEPLVKFLAGENQTDAIV
jgi:hypothetical protein